MTIYMVIATNNAQSDQLRQELSRVITADYAVIENLEQTLTAE